MTDLRATLQPCVDQGTVPGAVALVARGDRVEVLAVGSADVEGTRPMARDSIFRIASITKPITAAAAMVLVEDGAMGLDDPIGTWLPELASPVVVRTPQSPVDDVVPAARPITVHDLLTSRAGWGFPDDFSLPAVALLFERAHMHGRDRDAALPPDEWTAALAGIPLLAQPGEAFLYNTSYDVLGVLIARVAGSSLPDFLAERLFGPLGMVDTGFEVPAGDVGRLTSAYQPDPAGGLRLLDPPDGELTKPTAFPSGAGGLVSTVDDWHSFGRMLLGGGSIDGRRVLSPDSVRRMTTDHLTPAQRDAGRLFLEGQGWGYGGSVDVAVTEPWTVPGRYGWVGGSGTTAHVTPSTGTVAVLMTQVEMTGPTPTPMMRSFWRAAAA
jgi:CubicO group peptidase (beta-lactamase class C family)